MKTKKTHKIHTQEFKQETVNLAAKQGVATTEKELGVYESQNLRLAHQTRQES
jgi:transposase-like protein